MTKLHQAIDEHRMLMRALGWVVLVLLAWYVFGSLKTAMDAGGTKASADVTTTTAPSTSTTVPAAKPATAAPAKAKDEETSDSIGRIEVVIAGSLNMRETADKSSELVSSIPTGTELNVLSKTGSWYQVESPDGDEGYVSSNPRFVKVLEME